MPVLNPSTAKPAATFSLGIRSDVNHAIIASPRAFAQWSNPKQTGTTAFVSKLPNTYARRAEGKAQAITAEMIDEAGFPVGIFNLVNGDGAGVGSALPAHPDNDMMSFTGSTRAGIAVGKASMDTMKRTTLELGGKSPNALWNKSKWTAPTSPVHVSVR